MCEHCLSPQVHFRLSIPSACYWFDVESTLTRTFIRQVSLVDFVKHDAFCNSLILDQKTNSVVCLQPATMKNPLMKSSLKTEH